MTHTRRHALKDKSGKYRPSSKSPAIRWTKPGSEGFWNFIEDTSLRVISHNKYVKWKPTQKQKEYIENILAVDIDRKFIIQIALVIAPRRFGKSVCLIIIIIWLFFSRINYTIQLLGVTEQHTIRTQLNVIKGIIQNTPKLARLVPEKDFRNYAIMYPAKNNKIQMSAGSSTATAYGDRIDLLFLSDFHNFVDLQPWFSFQSALLDASESLILIDSNVDSTDGHVHSLQAVAKQDESIYSDHLFFKDMDDYMEKAPKLAPWINFKRAKRQQRTTFEVDWKRDLLGQRSDARNALFPANVISLCKTKYQIPVSDISELTQGRSFRVGAGLDRSKSLFGGDATVWTCILKVASPKFGELEFFILNQQVIIPNTSRMIKKAILTDHEKYNLHKITLENYEVTDIAGWLSDQKIPFELVSAHNTNQNISFTEFYRIAKEGRFHFPASLRGLAKEMSTFTYTQKTGGVYSFGHSSQKFKDDRVYSCNWAIFSLRDAVMNLYTLGNIHCKNKSVRRHMCALMGGNLILLCSEQCQAFHEVEAMFREFKQYQLDSELTIPEFFESKVSLQGARISQAA